MSLVFLLAYLEHILTTAKIKFKFSIFFLLGIGGNVDHASGQFEIKTFPMPRPSVCSKVSGVDHCNNMAVLFAHHALPLNPQF